MPRKPGRNTKNRTLFPYLMVGGSGQDAGIPQLGCNCKICNKARKNRKYQRLGPSIAIIDKKNNHCFLIDASPDIKHQLAVVKNKGITTKNKRLPINGILLTHAHIGHCIGLLQFGKEAANTQNLPVFCTKKMKQFLVSNYPFSLLVKKKNILIKTIKPGKKFKLGRIECMAIALPHRHEMADTVGYIIKSKKRLVYLPDIDYWTGKIINAIKKTDIALIDGTFYSEDELPRFKQVPHPPIVETIRLLSRVKTKIYFTHLNHTNPVNDRGTAWKYVSNKGFKIAADGLILNI